MSDIVLSSDNVPEEVSPANEAEELAKALGRSDPERTFESGAEMSVFFEAYGLSLDGTSGLKQCSDRVCFPPGRPGSSRGTRLRPSSLPAQKKLPRSDVISPEKLQARRICLPGDGCR